MFAVELFVENPPSKLSFIFGIDHGGDCTLVDWILTLKGKKKLVSRKDLHHRNISGMSIRKKNTATSELGK